MAHIANMFNNSIAREFSPPSTAEPTADVEEKGREKHVWGVHQLTEIRKYQLFPAKDKLSTMPRRNSPDPEQAFAFAMGKTNNPTDRPLLSSAMRLKAKEQSLIRRRKASISDLGPPMTTVQEVAMDSPTIPGRPPLHERSASAPGNGSSRQGSLEVRTESIMSGLVEWSNGNKSPPKTTSLRRGRSNSPGTGLPKTLPPLVIPQNTGSVPQRFVVRQLSLNQLNLPEDTPPAVPPKSARILGLLDEKASPRSRTPYTPYTPLTGLSNLSVPRSATQISIPDGRVSPLPASMTNRTSSPIEHSRSQSETTVTYAASSLGHRRERSEASIMDRGRPVVKQRGSKPCHVAEQKAFEALPKGIKAHEVPSILARLEIDSIRQQAMGQAAKFEILSMKDVEGLSRELRALDERCDYLRRTHHSLRSGRRNLQDRICSYLRSPRTAQFSHASLLKQEESLVELDLSIDDWVNKLEQAENRRARVQQKLLEHVAAALTLQTPVDGGVRRLDQAASRSLRMGENTPPRSPTKEMMTTSPRHLARPISPATIHEEDVGHNRMSKESIRIYADSDIYALLADVEEEINRIDMESARISSESSGEILSAVAFSEPHKNSIPSLVA